MIDPGWAGTLIERDLIQRSQRRGLRLGAVVIERPNKKYGTKGGERGQVIWWNGRGWGSSYRIFSDDLYVIQRGAGTYTVGNNVDGWDIVPEREWSTVERVTEAAVTWDQPHWVEEGEDPQEGDSFEFAVIAALLSVDEHERVFGDFDWPTSNMELITNVAKWIDRVVETRGFGAVLRGQEP